MNHDKIVLAHPQDIAFTKIAQHALVNGTTLPSGYRTPDEDMEIVGTELVPVSRDEWEGRTWSKQRR